MINFYNLLEVARLALVFLIAVTIFSQSLAFLLSFYRKLYNQLYLIIDLFELVIILNLLLMAMILGQSLNAYDISISPPLSYSNLRIIIFIITLLLFIVLTYNTKSYIYFIGFVASIVILPKVEVYTQHWYLSLYTFSIIILFFRSLLISKNSIKHIRSNVSALSIVQAINTMDTGILYSQANGRIVIINDKMQELMILLAGRMYRNANDFYNLIISENENDIFINSGMSLENICLMPDGSAWMFNKQEIILSNKVYNHISATDVSVQYSLTKKLKEQSEILQAKSDNLKETIDNLYEISQKSKIDYIQNRVHDILGQHISYMLMLINEDKPLDYKLLKNFSDNLISQIWQEEASIDPVKEIKNLQSIFNTIGVAIKIKGELPKEEKIMALLLEIVREATTNAVRHGFATKILVDVKKKKSKYYFTISNNGHLTDKEIVFGSGLSDMENKVIGEGGKINIYLTPNFIIEICIPGGGISEKGINSR